MHAIVVGSPLDMQWIMIFGVSGAGAQDVAGVAVVRAVGAADIDLGPDLVQHCRGAGVLGAQLLDAHREGEPPRPGAVPSRGSLPR